MTYFYYKLSNRVPFSISYFTTVIMASSIKLFYSLQKFLRIIGICPPQSTQNTDSLNLTNKFLIISFVLIIFTTLGFISFAATSLFDYGFAFYILIAIISASVIYLLLIRQFEETFDFIENCEQFIEKRKYYYL